MGFGIFELFFVLCVLFGLCSCCRKIFNEDSSNYTPSSCENQNVSVAIAASLATYYEEIEETLEKFGRKPANQFIYYQENIECPICIEKIEADDFLYNIPCQHLFHKKCLFDCAKNNFICPNCRVSFIKK